MLIDFGSVEKARMNVNELKGSAKMDVQEEAEVTSTPAFRPPEIFDLGGIFGDIVVDERVDVWVSLVLFFTSSAPNDSSHSLILTIRLLLLLLLFLTFSLQSLGCTLYTMFYYMNPFDVQVIKGGSIRMAVVNGKVDFPKDAEYKVMEKEKEERERRKRSGWKEDVSLLYQINFCRSYTLLFCR